MLFHSQGDTYLSSILRNVHPQRQDYLNNIFERKKCNEKKKNKLEMLWVSFSSTTHQQHLWNTEIHNLTLGITASSRQRTRLNNKTANPELRNLCSWVEVWQDVAYSNPSSPTRNGGHVINTSPTMLYYLMVLTSFNLILGYGKWGDYEDSTARMGLKKLKYVIWQYDISHRTSHPRARKWVCTYPS